MSAIETHEDLELQQDLRRLKDLIEASEVDAARRLAPELARKWPESRAIQHFAEVLEPPRVTRLPPGSRPPARSFKEDHRWLREHGHEYPGCYLVTLGYRLIAADPDAYVVREKVKALVDLENEVPLLTLPIPRNQPLE